MPRARAVNTDRISTGKAKPKPTCKPARKHKHKPKSTRTNGKSHLDSLLHLLLKTRQQERRRLQQRKRDVSSKKGRGPK
jgi:hypothetical protein